LFVGVVCHRMFVGWFALTLCSLFAVISCMVFSVILILLHKFQEEVAVFISWMVHPYAKSFAMFVFGLMIYQSFVNPIDDAHSNGWRGLCLFSALFSLS
jgi:hypothetical protein